MPVGTPPPAYSAAQVQAAAARRLRPQAAISRKVQAKKKKGKWTIGDTFVPGVDGVTYEEFTPELQGNQLSSFAAFPDRNVILRARGQTRDKGAIAHEMGHILSRYLTDENKKNFMGIMGFQPGEWNTGTGATAGGLKSPNEFFADYYSSVVNRVDPRRQSIAAYAHDINRKRLRRFAIALAELGRYNQLGAYKEPDWGQWS